MLLTPPEAGPGTHTGEGLRAAITARSHLPGAPMLVPARGRLRRGRLPAQRPGSQGRGVLDALGRVACGATVLDPQVIAQLLAGQRRANALGTLTARERQLLALMAEGHSNTAIAQRLVISASAVEKHISSIFAKLGLPPDDAQHRRVLAVLAYLRV